MIYLTVVGAWVVCVLYAMMAYACTGLASGHFENGTIDTDEYPTVYASWKSGALDRQTFGAFVLLVSLIGITPFVWTPDADYNNLVLTIACICAIGYTCIILTSIKQLATHLFGWTQLWLYGNVLYNLYIGYQQ